MRKRSEATLKSRETQTAAKLKPFNQAKFNF